MQLPFNNNLPINYLSAVFNKTSASYKFYWFISMMEIVVEENKTIIPLRTILIKMICNAWYPVHYYKISFGFSDLLSQHVQKIQALANFPIDISKSELYNVLVENTNKDINNLISHFDKHVPFRFLSPWFPNTTNQEITQLSQNFTNNCLYKIGLDKEKSIEINKHWVEYLQQNYQIIHDFSYWNLALFLQTKNPNVPDIPNKLIKPIKRSPLLVQRKFWNIVFDSLHEIPCIYTKTNLTKENYAVEHFIPHSFVSHDLLWNLIPANTKINSSKSNKLPILSDYIEQFASMQQKAIRIVYEKQPHNKMLENYLILGGTISDIIQLPETVFKSKYYNVISPLIQIAENMGFEYWNYKKA